MARQEIGVGDNFVSRLLYLRGVAEEEEEAEGTVGEREGESGKMDDSCVVVE